MKQLMMILLVLGVMVAGAVAKEGPYRHVVLFKFKDDAPKEEVANVEKAFAALKGKIDLIQDYEWGTNVSPEGLDNGFTHCFFVTFKSKADLMTSSACDSACSLWRMRDL